MPTTRTYIIYHHRRNDHRDYVAGKNRRDALVNYLAKLRADGIEAGITQNRDGGRYYIETAAGDRYGAHAA